MTQRPLQDRFSSILEYSLFVGSLAGVYTAGVYSQVPTGIVAIAGMQIVRQTVADALINLTYSGIAARLAVFFLFIEVFTLVRILISMFALFRFFLPKRWVLRKTLSAIRVLDATYKIVVESPGRISFLLTMPIFGYICIWNWRLALFALIVPFAGMGLVTRNRDFSDRNILRIKLRVKSRVITTDSLVRSSLLASALIFAFVIGVLRVDALVDYGSNVAAKGWPNGSVLIVSLDKGVVLAASESSAGGAIKRVWYFAPNPLSLMEFRPKN